MAVNVYVIKDARAIEFIENGDLDGFKGYLKEDPYLDFGEAENFESEAEAIAFCSGLGYGADERVNISNFPLRSSEETDVEFIEAIERL